MRQPAMSLQGKAGAAPNASGRHPLPSGLQNGSGGISDSKTFSSSNGCNANRPSSAVTPNMPKGVKNEPFMELICSLCPKNPKFSDVSHLLTHISSKSHLSHRFKLQIRSQSENEAKEKLDNFDYWYHNNNLDTMLSERLAAKEQKKTAKERKSRASNVSMKNTKVETQPAEEVLAATPVFRAPVPRMHLWPTINTGSSTPTTDWEENNVYSTPTMRRKVPNFGAAESTPGDNMRDPNPATPWKRNDSEVFEKQDDEKYKVEEKLSDGTKLKGVLWPGMNLFDSATPEMKRMRNQRKDSSILYQMMATSTGVEPTEVVYHPDGQVSHSRDIFGPLSTENSPNGVDDTSPRKRKTRKVAALSDISVNAPRIRAPRPKKNTVSKAPLKRPSATMQSHGPPPHPFMHPPILNPLATFGQRYVPSSEEDEEFRMTVGDVAKKRPFGIFQDAPEVSPGRTESSLEDHRFDFSGDRSNGCPTDGKSSSYISPTPAAKQPAAATGLGAARGFGKENGKSGLSPHYHVRQTISTSSSHMFPAQFLYDPTMNPIYDPAFARTFPYAAQHPGFNQDFKPPPPRFHSTFHGEFRPIHPIPRPSGPQGRGAGPSNNPGHGVHYGV